VSRPIPPPNVRIGVHGGRSWHIRSGRTVRSSAGIYSPETLCGKAGDNRWSPGSMNRDCGTCGACLRRETR
jgi:hypothetical protein